MKYLKEYSEEEIRDLESDLKSVGLSDWMGFYITYIVTGDDATGASSIAVIGNSWESIAETILENFGIDDAEEAEIDIERLGSIESILDSIDNFYSTGMGENWSGFKYEFWEMTPKKLENSIETGDLLDIGDALKMGRQYFSDFDSVVLRPRS
jgi:acyl carrier protein